ncbi:inositol monophosphatase family protein [Microbacterium hydrocarbonoxydans]|uniref:inositol monophosphatase family protein n=1 Tax=Microbacterium hydrocarbonoxydans TaxID=273678 RepID=UPI0013DB2C1F|nr:inositol monophosphatase family protein [Microbacterium hydrocarbonoxydans]
MTFAQHPQLAEFLEFIQELGDTARRVLTERHDDGRFETKADRSPVTEFDRGVEADLRSMIRGRFPEHGIIGEEFEPEQADAEFVWIMDPIDGTKSFVAGVPVFTTLVALCRDGVPVIGMIDASVSRERWVGVQGRATTLNGQPVRTSGRKDLSGATLSWSQPDNVLDEHREGFRSLSALAAWSVFGAASYGFGRLAAGAIDVAAYSGGIGAYDVCALVPIVEGAGGRITDADGSPLTLAPPRGCVAAATPALHARVIHVLNTPTPAGPMPSGAGR